VAAATIEPLIEGFSHPQTIAPIIGLPTFKTITKVIRLLNANVTSVQSDANAYNLYFYFAIVVSTKPEA
jgi:hypothetical protein